VYRLNTPEPVSAELPLKARFISPPPAGIEAEYEFLVVNVT